MNIVLQHNILNGDIRFDYFLSTRFRTRCSIHGQPLTTTWFYLIEKYHTTETCKRLPRNYWLAWRRWIINGIGIWWWLNDCIDWISSSINGGTYDRRIDICVLRNRTQFYINASQPRSLSRVAAKFASIMRWCVLCPFSDDFEPYGLANRVHFAWPLAKLAQNPSGEAAVGAGRYSSAGLGRPTLLYSGRW